LAELRSRLGVARRWLLELYRSVERTRTTGLAAETSFWLFLSLLPLLAVAGLIAARLSLENWQELAPLLDSLPQSSRELVTSQLREVARWNGGAVGVSGAVAFLWLASTGIHAVFEALEVESGVSRPWLRQRLLALLCCLLLSLAVALVTAVEIAMSAALNTVGGMLPLLSKLVHPTPEWNVGRTVLGFATLFGQAYGLYWLGIPTSARRKMPLWPGALLTTGLQATLAYAYGTYVAVVGGGAAYSAGLSIVGLTLMGLYLFSLALLLGAVVNRQLSDACA
jgi:membrane protein